MSRLLWPSEKWVTESGKHRFVDPQITVELCKRMASRPYDVKASMDTDGMVRRFRLTGSVDLALALR